MASEGRRGITEAELDLIRRQAMEFAEIGLYRCLRDGTVAFMDTAAFKLLELEDAFRGPGDVTGRNLGELVTFLAPEGLWENVSGEKDIRGIAFQVKTARGTEKWLLHDWYFVRAANPEEDGFQVVVRSVASQHRAEEALRQSEERFRSLYDAVPSGVIVYDSHGVITHANKAATEILRLRLDEMLGQDPKNGLWSAVWEDGTVADPLEHPSKITIRTGKPARNVLFGLRVKKKSDLLWLIINTEPLMNPQTGKVKEVLLTFIDITGLRAAEEDRRNLEAQVQHAQKLESLGILAGGIAHDFNNLLMGILGNADLALMELSSESSARRYLIDIEETSRRAAELCRQMLAYAGKGRFVVEPLNLSSVVEDMAHLLNISVSKKAVLKFNLATELPALEGDATQVRQVIMNLITNASDALADQSGTITLTTALITCDRNYLKGTYVDENLTEGDYIYLEVADTGCGMPPEVVSRIFDPFYTTKFTGRGLGLAAVLGIVRSHGGSIKVYTEPNVGTSVKVLFPATDKIAVEPARPKRETDGWRGEGTILLADDEDAVRNVANQMLKKIGFKVLTAYDGTDALNAFQRHADDITCVLLDLTMPHMDGEETFRQIRRINKNVPVILTSGYNEQEVVGRFVGREIAGFLQKPFTYTQLFKKLRETLDKNHEVSAEN